MTERLREASQIDNARFTAWVSTPQKLYIETEQHNPIPFTIDEAKALRDWLIKALPCAHNGMRTLLAEGVDPDIITGRSCDLCGERITSETEGNAE
jgi:hypothetical protein